MEKEQADEFSKVREAAYDALRFRSQIEDGHSISVCQFLILPTFGNSISWDVVKVRSRRNSGVFRLYRSCWRMDLDAEAMRTPVERLKHPRPYQPTMEKNWVPMDDREIDAILSSLRAVRIPLVPVDRPMGCDGTSFELTVGDPYCYARIGWWCRMPREWQDLAPLLEELEHLFEQCWDRGRGHQAAV